MPGEVMASRGRDTLRFGTLKPVGLADGAYGIVRVGQVAQVFHVEVLVARNQFLAVDADEILKRPTHVFDERTVCGALQTHISTPTKDFQPMNANFGILAPMPVRIRDKKERYHALAQRALDTIREMLSE